MSAPVFIGADPWWLYILIGMGFGFALESSGFGDGRKIAAQFYFRDNTVMKVMFTAIVVAAVLIHLSAALGVIDLSLVYVNPTYLWPGIVGGLLMGVGFIVGGYCPGTSIVSMATGKVDGAFFLLGIGTGAFIFGETVGLLGDWWYSAGYLGRFTLYDWLGVDAGVLVVGAVLLAAAFFAVAELIRSKVHHRPLALRPGPLAFGAVGLVLAVVVAVMGQPSLEERWQHLAERYQPRLDRGEVAIDPGELLELMNRDELKLVILDVRDEADWNQFHLVDAWHLPLERLPASRQRLAALGDQAVVVAVSNDEKLSRRAWQLLVAMGLPNSYLLAGGLNNWLAVYGKDLEPRDTAEPGQLRYRLPMALGDRHPAANPDPHHVAHREFQPKVKLRRRVKAAGGCG